MLEVSGDYAFANPAAGEPGPRADAEWSQTVRGTWANPWEFYPAPYDPALLDLLVNDQDVDWMGTTDGMNFAPHVFSPSHVYRLNVIGTGSPLKFHILDTAYADNSGVLAVEITAVPEPLTVVAVFTSIGGLACYVRRRKR